MLLIPIMLLAFSTCDRPVMDPVEPSEIATPALLEDALPVPVDLQPFTAGNVVNLATRSAVSVAILDSETSDVTTLDPSGARVGAGLAAPAHASTADSPTDHVRDISVDGIDDMMFHFDKRAAGFQRGPARTT